MSVELTRDPPKALNWDPNKQMALFGHVASDPKFFAQVRGRMAPEWFVDPYSSRGYKAMQDFQKEFNRPPTIAELRDYREFRLEDRGWYSKFLTHLDKCLYLRQDFPLDHLRRELSDWMRARIFHTAVERAVPLFNAEKPTAAYHELDVASKEIRDANFEADREVHFDNPEALFNTTKEEYEGALTFGIDCFDRLLLPEGNAGSLLLGDTTILMAPSNVGKTTAMITIIRHNIIRQRPTLFLVHEGGVVDLQLKLWCSLLRVTKGQLMQMYSTEEGQTKIERMLKVIKKFLTFVPIIKPGLNVEEVQGVIERKIEDRIAKYGSGYALVVDDYPAKLMTQQAGKGNWARRQIDDYVYNQFVAMAGEHHFHSLLAIQTNRDGSKVNNNRWGKESRLLTMEDVSESWGPMTAATNVITLNRDPVAMARHRLTYYICKSRSSETGWAVVCRTDYAKALTHSNELGARYYQSSSTLADRIDDLLNDENMGEEIPKEAYLK